MSPEFKQRVQVALLLAIVVAAARTGWILYERHRSPAGLPKPKSLPLNSDYYVTPKKLYAYDLKSARALTQQPVWAKEGYKYTYYSYNPATGHTDFHHQAGLLLPLEKLEVKDVVLDSSPTKGQNEVMAVFDKNGEHYALPVGAELKGDYHIYVDEIFFIEDPKALYRHWPADIWAAIENHQVRIGMSELQADFAIGMGVPETSMDPEIKTVNYPNGGKPVTIIYQNGKAIKIITAPAATSGRKRRLASYLSLGDS